MSAYAQGSIAGVNLEVSGEPMKAIILDGANLQSAFAINNRISASGNVFTQSMPISGGRRFGVRLDYCPIDVIRDIIVAIQAAIGDQETFNVSLVDDAHDVNTQCVPDGSGFLTYPEQRITGGYIKGVVLRFLTVS